MAEFVFESQGVKNYLVYTLPAGEVLDSMTLGMLTNNKIAGLAPTHFMQMNADRFVKYDISSKISVTDYFAGSVSKKKLLHVLEGVSKALLSAEEYMLDESCFVLDTNYIYIDVSSLEVNLICLPTSNPNPVDFGMFLKTIMFNTQFDQSENCDYIARIMNFINKGTGFALPQLRSLLDEMKGDTSSGVGMAHNAPLVSQMNATTVVHNSTTAPVEPKPTISPAQTSQPSGQQQAVTVPPSNLQVNQPLVSPAANTSQAAISEEKQMGLLGLLTHYSKDNLELYKAQKAAKKAEKPPVKKEKSKPQKDAPQLGFAIPGQIPTQSATMGKAPTSTSVQTKTMVSPGMKMASKSSVSPSQTAPQTQPVSSVNFGETTVLGGTPSFGETTVLNGTGSVEMVRSPFLIRKRTGEKIPINKPVFRIGKERSFVDYFIADNTAISRSHANIITKNQVYYVTDTNSTNHTYVNGKLIASNVETPISSGDIIKLANEEFCFELL